VPVRSTCPSMPESKFTRSSRTVKSKPDLKPLRLRVISAPHLKLQWVETTLVLGAFNMSVLPASIYSAETGCGETTRFCRLDAQAHASLSPTG